jgi:plastocyanin
MTRTGALAALVVTAVTAVPFVATTAGAASHAKLIGVVGKNDAFQISLKDGKGKQVKTLKAGTYTFVIHDDSSEHNYELDGPHGRSWTFTSIGSVATKTKTIKLAKGKYKAYCAPHESFMFQRFTVK